MVKSGSHNSSSSSNTVYTQIKQIAGSALRSSARLSRALGVRVADLAVSRLDMEWARSTGKVPSGGVERRLMRCVAPQGQGKVTQHKTLKIFLGGCLPHTQSLLSHTPRFSCSCPCPCRCRLGTMALISTRELKPVPREGGGVRNRASEHGCDCVCVSIWRGHGRRGAGADSVSVTSVWCQCRV